MFLAKLFSFKQLLNLSTSSDSTMESPEDLSYKPVSVLLTVLVFFSLCHYICTVS